MYLLIDECCGKGLVVVASEEGHVAQRTIETAELGRGATDAAIFAFSRTHRATLVTINQGDFIDLANTVEECPGIILLPAAHGMEVARLFRMVLRATSKMISS